MAPPATPTRAQLNQQAAKLRDQAHGLTRRYAERDEAIRSDLGTRFDDARRASAEARAAANTATERADEMHARAKSELDRAKRLETQADQKALSTDPAERETADGLREQAQRARATAASATQRAQRSEQAARQKMQEVDRADHQAVQLQREHDDALSDLDHLQTAAGGLQDKAVLLEQAARELASADRGSSTPQEREQYRARARATLAKADAVKPDFSGIDPQDIVAAGIPMTEVPGNELMDPNALPFISPGSAPANDTDLMDPNAVDPVDPVDPGTAPDPAPVDVHDTDLMDPGADPVLGPGSSGADDTGLMDPSTQASLPDPVSDPLSDPLDQARADLAGDLDPYGDVPDAGDFGFAPIDAPSAAPDQAAVVSASVSTDAYMDQPDVGSTSSYTDVYGDTADDMTGEYA